MSRLAPPEIIKTMWKENKMKQKQCPKKNFTASQKLLSRRMTKF